MDNILGGKIDTAFLDSSYVSTMTTFSKSAVAASDIILISQLGIFLLLYFYIFIKSTHKIHAEILSVKEVIRLFSFKLLLLLSSWLVIIGLGDFLFTLIEQKPFLAYIDGYINFRNGATKIYCGGKYEYCTQVYVSMISGFNPYRDFDHFKVIDLLFHKDGMLLIFPVLSMFTLHRFLSASSKVKEHMKSITIICILITIMLFLSVLRFI